MTQLNRSTLSTKHILGLLLNARHCHRLAVASGDVAQEIAWNKESCWLMAMLERAKVEPSMSNAKVWPHAPKRIDTPKSETTWAPRNLPKYATGANPARLVQILCKGHCVDVLYRKLCTRWAEMEVDFPGQEILRKSQLGDFRAKCLKCGSIARDCYKWTR